MSRYRGLIVLLMDVALIFCCNFVIFLSDLFVENVQLFNLLMHIGLLTVCVLVFQLALRTYNTLWRYAESREYLSLLGGMSLGFALYAAVNLLMGMNPVWISGALTGTALALLAMLAYRFIYRIYRRRVNSIPQMRQSYAAIVGGGSIGSELCRQIAEYRPARLVIVDIAENTTYELQNDLLYKYGDSLNMSVEIASVRDKKRLEQIFDTYRPQVVFHAAAHKHVPLMEGSPAEAVKNNVFGTYNTALTAREYGAEKFVLISTDKAVNPTNVMGATKYLCEQVLQGLRREGGTEFAAVRFGNVLGSSGSVIPLFKKQIARGGPVTVTDKRIVRYFMTISEAVQLVLEAGSFAHSGEVFVLDMGEPVHILELAEKMIRLSGFTPYVDIEIREVGLRPGEKLYEELLISGKDLRRTENAKIFVEERPMVDNSQLCWLLEQLRAAAESNDTCRVTACLHELVPTFRTPEEVNGAAIRAMEHKEVV